MAHTITGRWLVSGVLGLAALGVGGCAQGEGEPPEQVGPAVVISASHACRSRACIGLADQRDRVEQCEREQAGRAARAGRPARPRRAVRPGRLRARPRRGVSERVDQRDPAVGGRRPASPSGRQSTHVATAEPERSRIRSRAQQCAVVDGDTRVPPTRPATIRRAGNAIDAPRRRSGPRPRRRPAMDQQVPGGPRGSRHPGRRRGRSHALWRVTMSEAASEYPQGPRRTRGDTLQTSR